MGGVKYSVHVFWRLQNVTDTEAISLTLREFLWPIQASPSLSVWAVETKIINVLHWSCWYAHTEYGNNFCYLINNAIVSVR